MNRGEPGHAHVMGGALPAAVSPTISTAMRRRIRSAAIPLHRHSLPQLAVDGALVALAYWLAYRLRFDGPAGVPARYERALRRDVHPRRRRARCSSSPRSACTRKWWRYVTQRDYTRDRPGGRRRRARCCCGYIALVKPVTRTVGGGETTVTAPSGVLALHLLLMLDLRRRHALRRAHGLRAPAARLSRAQGRARPADRRRRRRRAPRPARDPAQPRAAASSRSASSTTTRSSGACGSTACACSARRSELGRILDEVEPDEVTIAIPSAPGIAARERRALLPRARDPGAHAADGLRAAAERRRPRARRCATCRSRTSSAASRCSWSSTASAPTSAARSCSSPARAARSARSSRARSRASRRAGWSCSTTPRTTSFTIQRELEHDRHVHPSTLDVGARRLQGGGADARGLRRSTARPSSSTPPPTSTSA